MIEYIGVIGKSLPSASKSFLVCVVTFQAKSSATASASARGAIGIPVILPAFSIRAGFIPSANIATPSPVYVPNTRLV